MNKKQAVILQDNGFVSRLSLSHKGSAQPFFFMLKVLLDLHSTWMRLKVKIRWLGKGNGT